MTTHDFFTQKKPQHNVGKRQAVQTSKETFYRRAYKSNGADRQDRTDRTTIGIYLQMEQGNIKLPSTIVSGKNNDETKLKIKELKKRTRYYLDMVDI